MRVRRKGLSGIVVALLITSMMQVALNIQLAEAVEDGEIVDIRFPSEDPNPTYSQGDLVELWVDVYNPTPDSLHYLVVVNIFNPSMVKVWDSDEVGANRDAWVDGYTTAYCFPFIYRIPDTAPTGTYHMLAGLRMYPWEPELDFRGLDWCPPEETFSVLSDPTETIWGMELSGFDNSGDGYDDAAFVRLDVDTTDGTLDVTAYGYLYNPSNNIVDTDSSTWTITSNDVEWGELYLYVPNGESVGQYRVYVEVYDNHGNFEDSAQGYLDPLYPPDYTMYYPLHLESDQDTGATQDLGQISLDGTPFNLPNDLSAEGGGYTVQYSVVSGYLFDHWETTSGISVSNQNNNPTFMTVSSPGGTLRAVYTLTSGQVELYYDDGSAEGEYATSTLPHFKAVRFHTPTTETYTLGYIKYYISNDPSSFELQIRDSSTQIVFSETVTPTAIGWFVVDLISEGIYVQGDFYVAMKYLTVEQPKLGADYNDPDLESGEGPSFPAPPNLSSLDWMIRAVLGENQMPTAYIDSINPNPANESEIVNFSGHGSDPDGTIVEYSWESSLNGFLSDSSSFSTPSLSIGTNIISFKVRDNTGLWSILDTEMLTIQGVSGKPPAPRGVHDMTTYESRIGEQGFLFEDDNVQMWVPAGYENHSRIIFYYLVAGYENLSSIFGDHSYPYKFSVEHYPPGSPYFWGGTDGEGTIRYGYSNLEDDTPEWNIYGVPHMRGYYEEMAHCFIYDFGVIGDAWGGGFSVGFYETLGLMMGSETALRAAYNPYI
jgi:hypothetical protein